MPGLVSVAEKARDDVDMRVVEDELPRRRVVVHGDVYSSCADRLLDRRSEPLRDQHEVREQVFGKLVYVRIVPFRDNEHVALIDRIYVEYREDAVVLVDFPRWKLSRDYPAEDALSHCH